MYYADEGAEISSDYQEDMQFVKCQEKCSKCGAPKHYKQGQGVPFCWECLVSKENARRGRDLLERVKMVALLKGQTYDEMRAADDQDKDQRRGPFRFGMPL